MRKNSTFKLVLFICLTFLGALSLDNATVSTLAEYGVKLPIIMYHSVLDRPSRLGTYVISPQELENDLKYLHDRGFETVTVSDLTAYVDLGIPLPEKPVMLTFDDGFLNTMTSAAPLLEKYSYKAVVSVVGAFSEQSTIEADPNPNYAYLTWEQMREVSENGTLEIQSHSYNMHGADGRAGLRAEHGESEEENLQAVKDDLLKMQLELSERSGVTATAFAYPFGYYKDIHIPLLEELGFRVTFTCEERVNILTREESSLFQLGRYNRPSGVSTATFMSRLGIE